MDGTCRVGPGVDIVYLKLVCNLFSLVCPQCPMAHFSVKQIWSAALIKLVGQRPAMMKTLTEWDWGWGTVELIISNRGQSSTKFFEFTSVYWSDASRCLVEVCTTFKVWHQFRPLPTSSNSVEFAVQLSLHRKNFFKFWNCANQTEK